MHKVIYLGFLAIGVKPQVSSLTSSGVMKTVLRENGLALMGTAPGVAEMPITAKPRAL
jgi:hypothetical protein